MWGNSAGSFKYHGINVDYTPASGRKWKYADRINVDRIDIERVGITV